MNIVISCECGTAMGLDRLTLSARGPILTYKVDPRTERIEIFPMAVDP